MDSRNLPLTRTSCAIQGTLEMDALGNSDPCLLEIPLDIFVLRKRKKAVGRRDFTFTNDSDDVVFTVGTKSSDSIFSRNTKLLLDSSGNTLISISHCRDGSWEGFREVDGCQKVLVFKVRGKLTKFNRSKLEVTVFDKNQGVPAANFTMIGCSFYRSCTIFGGNSIVAQSRPFGVSLLIAGFDENGPCLYYTDPSGTFWLCDAKAIGSGSEGADTSLQELYDQDLTVEKAETIALSILKQVMEEKVTADNVDIAKVAPTYRLYSPAEVEAVINRL